MINGKYIYLSIRYSDGTFYPLACDTSFTLSLTREVKAVTGPEDGIWRRYIPGNSIVGQITGNGLMAYDKHISVYFLQRALIEGTYISFICDIPAENGNVTYEGTGIVSKMDMTGAIRAAGTFTYQIELTGELETVSNVIIDSNETGIQDLLAVDEDNLLDIGAGQNLIV